MNDINQSALDHLTRLVDEHINNLGELGSCFAFERAVRLAAEAHAKRLSALGVDPDEFARLAPITGG